LLHEAPGGYAIEGSIVDLNRAGTPLLEIVTEPDLTTPRQVAAFGQELQKLVQFLGVSEGQMQMGHMRFEPNINVHITDQDGTVWKTAITEIKNLNSFSVLERATVYEIQRQIREWEETGSLGRKSTYGWDEPTESTFLQRTKEEANDYRYFPDPDLVPVEVDDAWLDEIRAQIGELPAARRKRYVAALPGVAAKEIETIAGDREIGDYFDAAVTAGAEPKQVLNLMTKVREVANENNVPMMKLGIGPARVAELARLIAGQKVAASSASAVLRKLREKDQPTEKAAEEAGVMLASDTGAIDTAIDALIAENPKSLQDYRGGKQAAFGGLVGLIMKAGKGFNAKVVQEQLRKKLGN
jgi:aspartyl-tRNA(Asn)/glutamyl-tRNA(Gln) amidotransferase subunit B